MKNSFEIKTFKDESLKVGDKVKIWDGSGFSYIGDTDEHVAIVHSYPEMTASNEKLLDIEGEVVEIGVTNRGVMGFRCIYLQDIVIKLGEGLFRSCSEFVCVVHKMETNPLLHQALSIIVELERFADEKTKEEIEALFQEIKYSDYLDEEMEQI